MNKYLTHRGEIKDGDVILFRSNKWLGKIIQWLDGAHYNHAGIAFWSNDMLFIVDSNQDGIRPEFMSIRMKKYIDWCIVRPRKVSKKLMRLAINKSLRRGNSVVKYDFMLALRVLFSRKFKVDLKFLGSSNRDICSEFAAFHLSSFTRCYHRLLDVTPQDLIRFADKDKIEVLFNDNIG